MAEIGRVRQNSYENYSEGQDRYARLNRRGELVVIDFFSQCIFDGRTFHLQIGVEDAPVNTTTTLDDTLGDLLWDNPTGYCAIPVGLQMALADFTQTSVAAINFMLEIDRAKARFSSGGTAYVPENLRTDRPRVAVGGAFYVGAPDITLAAATAVPGTIELWRLVAGIDNKATALGDEIGMGQFKFSAREHPTSVVVGVGSIIGHCGAAGADGTHYGNMQVIQLPSESVV